jgi:phenylacetate-CoA ligase
VPSDRESYLDACQPEIYTGDPLAFAELTRLPLRTRPKALISTAMQLSRALRTELETRFNCPVLDLYAMNECGPIAVAGTYAGHAAHALLQHRLYVEILDADGQVCPPGKRGEVVLSGGFNPFLPLLRYRTGDYASLDFAGPLPILIGLEGRPPVVFEGAHGQPINNIDVTGALREFALPQYTLHQSRNGDLTLTVPPETPDHTALRTALLSLFGPTQAVQIEESAALLEGKVVQYRREK